MIFHRPRSRGACVALVLSLALLALAPTRRAGAEADETFRPPLLPSVTLDGVVDDVAWKKAQRLPFLDLRVPVPGEAKPVKRTPDVRLGLSDGFFVFGARLDEDPGGSIGMHLMVAPEGTKSAADAISIDFRPVALRAPRYRAIGPAGVGRKHYRFEGVADAGQVGHWSLEARIPVADLVGTDTKATLRMAIALYSRTQNVVSVWPKGATWEGPAHWNRVRAPKAGWPLEASVDAARIASEDEADDKRQAAWLDYLKGASTPVLPTRSKKALTSALTKQLIEPLQEVMRHRPDLSTPVECQLGDIFHRLGSPVAASAHYADALARSPGWREAGYGLFVKVRGVAAASGVPGEATDYAAMERNLTTMFDEEEHPGAAHYARDGRRLAAALLDYKRGRFDPAIESLTALATRYPFDAFIDSHRRLALRGKRAAGEEVLRVKADAKKTLPRATLETTAGTIVLELFQDDARNTVFNFVWLAKHGFYDGCAIHRTVPGFLAQTGDPYTRKATAAPELVGSGTPGYAIRTELGKRAPLRGYVALANGGPNTDGSQFMLFTGTAVHLRGEVTVFARVVSGLEVLDALRAGTSPHRIEKVTLERLDPERTYHPSTLSGNRAPAPKAPER